MLIQRELWATLALVVALSMVIWFFIRKEGAVEAGAC